ncbi:unnamed protein product [Polarella glacialis]|uniref:Uncharacterized protein n=1 Tax=Polarella glacialis TaxID=89957 RepID=A0A813LZB2_POLGL|nr:unnamed protein product [Polarella glacialis]
MAGDMSGAGSSDGAGSMKRTPQKQSPRPRKGPTSGDFAESGPTRMQLLCQHGAVTAASPAARNRVIVPGPGYYTIDPKAEDLLRPANVRVTIALTPRFKKEGALFNPGVEMKGPGPAAYDVNCQSLGRYKVGKAASQPKWTIPKKPITEFAKTSF